MINLKTCPFCGGTAELRGRRAEFTDMVKVVCIDCGARTRGFLHNEEGRREAVEAWNQRVIA